MSARTIAVEPFDLVVFGGTGEAGGLVRLANKAGVKVVGYDSLLTDGPLDLMVMQDSWAVGTLQGQAMVDWFNRVKGAVKGRVAVIKGQPGDSNAELLTSGALEIIRQHPELEIVDERSHVDWSPDMARETAESLLVKHDNGIDAFICNNSGLAFGVLQALRDEGLDSTAKVFVAGADADLRNIRLIVQGAQEIDVWKKIKPLACRAADAALAIARAPDAKVTEIVEDYTLINNGFAEIPTIITPVVAVTRDTIDATVVDSAFLTHEQIYRP